MPELIEWPCDVPECHQLVVRSGAICDYCYEVRCSDHDTSQQHPCHLISDQESRRPKKRDIRLRYLSGLIEQLRLHSPTILEQASELNSNKKCTLTIPENADQLLDSGLLAGFNVHFMIEFEDGIKWLLRVRQDQGHPLPLQIRKANIESEVATLNTLKAGGIPVPAAFLHVPPEHEVERVQQEIPFDYFFYEFLPGETWHIPKHPFFSVTLSDEKLVKLVEGYAQVQIKLSQLQLSVSQIGCLKYTDSGELSVGPIIARGCFQTPKPPYLLGPFNIMKDRYLAHIDAALQYIARGAICEWDSVDAYLWHLELRELVSNSKVLGRTLSRVYIKHDDEKGDHLMWNEKEEVVGVLDWEWAHVTSKEEAFSSPYIFYDMIDYIRGDNQLTKEEIMLIDCYDRYNRPDLAECVKNGRLYQRLSSIGHYDKAYSKKGFREPFEPIPISDFHPPAQDVDWRVYSIKRYQNHKGLVETMKKFGVTLEKAEEDARDWHARND
ncbi:uncharacterized protein I206_102291 [Kwoniella pini CBS 10737]|uniref:Aminoglycoside phosphotransferase domain-containing protein n=1 Tax=Kwoniella pini CBS 10737 TaxID=1296096 RepID=A0A1B9HT32_9TREE|nr:uncharacterized protein I206_07661 [Kwoniella pini CBS 10737]OCF46427.1 hypothetical protein I206_07661 [Kwoniella pini CBS 10737]